MEVKNLRAYLANVDMSLKEFAKKIDCNYPHLSRILSGYSYPSRGLSRDIYEATGGIIKIPTKKEVEKKMKEETQDQRIAKAAHMASTMMTHFESFDEHKQD